MDIHTILYLVKPGNIVSTKHVIKSILGLLQGSPSELFQLNEDQKFVVNDGYQMKDLTGTCLKNFLKQFIRYGDNIHSLYDFCYDQNPENISITLTAYQTSLRALILCHIYKKINDILGNIDKMDSLLDFNCMLESSRSGYLLQKIEILFDIHQRITESNDFELNYTCTGHLLDVLHSYLNFEINEIRNMIWILFLNSIKPTLCYIEHLLFNGETDDPYEEFLFNVNNSSQEPDKFWDECLKLRESVSQGILTMPLLQLGIKSRLLLKTMKPEVNIDIEPRYSIFEKIIESLGNHIPLKLEVISNEEKRCPTVNFNLKLENYSNKTEYDNDVQIFDVNRGGDFNVSLATFDHQNINIDLNSFISVYKFSDRRLLPPLCFLLRKVIENTLSDAIEKISLKTLDFVRVEFENNLNIFNDYFLMQNGIFMDNYCNTMFHALLEDYITGTSFASKLLSQNYYLTSDENIKSFMSYDLNNKEAHNPLNKLRNLHFIYDDIDWVSRMLLDINCRQIYDVAFQFIIHLRYCKWLLDQTTFLRKNLVHTYSKDSKLQKIHKQQKVYYHQLSVIRFKLQFQINKLYLSVMTQINRLIVRLTSEAGAAKNFEEMKILFSKFMNDIQTVTTLRNKASKNYYDKIVTKACKQSLSIYLLFYKEANENELENCKIISEVTSFVDCLSMIVDSIAGFENQ